MTTLAAAKGELDFDRLIQAVDRQWEEEILPALAEYIRIPCKSPDFDSDWSAHGHMARGVDLLAGWTKDRLSALGDASLDIVTLPGRTPIILVEVPGQSEQTVLLYGHLDKQPEMVGWSDGLGPWTPVRRGDRLYGRGSVDDGYAIFAAVSALLALRDQNVSHSRCVILIEASEESGSCDLPYYIEHLAERIGDPSLVVCLDTGCGTYDRLWLTTSLRGMITGTLTVRVLTDGVHSGDASGIVPSSFRIARELLSRLEDERSGAVRPKELHAEIPVERINQATQAAEIVGDQVFGRFPWFETTRPMSDDLPELILNRTWRPQLAVTGANGLPEIRDAGSVLLPYTSLKISVRIPPTLDPKSSAAFIRRLLESQAPNASQVAFTVEHAMCGWDAPELSPWLDASLRRASQAAFGANPGYMGEGGSVPFMAMLGARFPGTQFVVTGAQGPHANAHGPDEFLHIPTAKRLTAAITQIIADHYAAQRATQS